MIQEFTHVVHMRIDTYKIHGFNRKSCAVFASSAAGQTRGLKEKGEVSTKELLQVLGISGGAVMGTTTWCLQAMYVFVWRFSGGEFVHPLVNRQKNGH